MTEAAHVVYDLDRLSVALFGELLDARTFLSRMYPEAKIAALDVVAATAAPLAARVNHGAWIVSCPCGARGQPSPGGIVSLTRPLVWCVRCSNQAVGRGWRPVAVPSASERAAIEAILLLRADVGDRNWEPSESVEELARQNVEHGERVPEGV